MTESSSQDIKDRLFAEEHSQSVLDAIMLKHKSAQHAFAVGDFDTALVMSDVENNEELFACSLVMCGAIERGLETLEKMNAVTDEALICRAYGHWWTNNRDRATSFLTQLEYSNRQQRASTLRSIMEQRNFKILLISPPTKLGPKPHNKNQGVCIHSIEVDRNAWTRRIEEYLPPDFEPDLVISTNAYGCFLPVGFFNLKAIKAFYVEDFDIGIHNQYEDLSRADILICGSFHERDMLSSLYPGRVISFTGHLPSRDPIPFAQKCQPKEFDVALTGSLFRTHLTGKAHFSFQIATAADPSIEVYMHDGYLEVEKYVSMISKSHLVPTTVRFEGGFQTRTIEAIRCGTRALVSEDRIAKLLLDESSFLIKSYTKNNLIENLGQLLSASSAVIKTFNEKNELIRDELDNIFLKYPDEEIRLAKFIIIQSILLRPSESKICDTPTIQHRLPSNWSFYGNQGANDINYYLGLIGEPDINLDDVLTLINGLFQQYLKAEHWNEEPGNIGLNRNSKKREPTTTLIEIAFNAAIARFPTSLILRFNRGRFHWMLGHYARGLIDFEWLTRNFHRVEMNIKRGGVFSHLTRAFNSMMPYESYYRAVFEDLQSDHIFGPKTRLIILATTLVYIAVDLLQNENLDEGIQKLREALEVCPEHFPATRLLTKASWLLGRADALNWFYRTIDLYPAYLGELLPFGVDMERRAGNDTKAIELVRTWALFIIRVEGDIQIEKWINKDTVAAARPYIDRLSTKVQRMLIDKLAIRSENFSFEPGVVAGINQ